jgi:hypothetical protein
MRPLALILLLLAPAAWADAPTLRSAEVTPGTGGKPPVVHVTFGVPAAGLQPNDVRVRAADGGDQAPSFPAHALIAATDAGGVADIVVLVEGTPALLGLPEIDPDHPAEPAAFEQVKASIDQIGAIPGKTIREALVTYGDAPRVIAPFAPGSRVHGDQLGPQDNFARVKKAGLSAGIEAALGLYATRPGRKILILIGDGEDAGAKLDAAAKKLGGVEIYAVLVAPGGIAPASQARLRELVGHGAVGSRLAEAAAPDQLTARASESAAAIQGVYNADVTWPSPGSPTLPFDGQVHPIAVVIGGQASAPLAVMLPRWTAGPVERLTAAPPGSYEVDAWVAVVTSCSCPPGAICGTCDRPWMVIADDPAATTGLHLELPSYAPVKKGDHVRVKVRIGGVDGISVKKI